MRRGPLLAVALALAGCLWCARDHDSYPGSHYLYIWAGDADRQERDFLAVVDVSPHSSEYATVVATARTDVNGSRPHHTEYEMPASGILWANGFDAGRTFLFDLHDPIRPVVLHAFGDPGAFTHPHSYARLANGHILSTFQSSAAARPSVGAGHGETGGLIEFDADGRVVRSSSAATDVEAGIRPYSLAVVPDLDRVVTTASDMHLHERSRAIQIWRLSDLTLLQTILLPPGARSDEQWLTAEPRVLGDGRTLLVNTFTCGLYRVSGLTGETASAEWVYSSPWQESAQKRFCAVPAVAGHFWIQTSGFEHAVLSLDVSDPSHPREVSRLTLGPTDVPHWIALEPDGDRLVITGYEGIDSRVLLAHVDRETGALGLETSFKAPNDRRPGIDFDRDQWPHGASGRAIPHRAVFSRR